jgi:hypothetical protein
MDYQEHLRSLSDAYNSMYNEGYKDLPKNKMQDKAAMKPDTAHGEKQARKMDLVRNATAGNEGTVKKVVKGQEMANRKKGLERKFNAPSADNAAEKARKNKAYGLEGQRRRDLDKRYGPKKESSHWLAQNGFSLQDMQSLGDAYLEMYNITNEDIAEEVDEYEIIDEYAVSDENAIALEEGKKKCKEGYKYDSKKKKCVKKKKKSSSSGNKTTVVVKTGGRGGFYGGMYPGYGSGGGGGDNGGDGETESNGGGDGGDGGGGGE